MKWFPMRKLMVPLALACAGTQVASGSALLASAITLGFRAHDHAHEASLVAEPGHLDLVLSHEKHGGRQPAARRDGDPTTSVSERDHVFHLPDDDTANTTPRRGALAPAPAPATAVAMLPAPTPLWLRYRAPEPRARSSDFLRTVLLRL